MGFLDKINYSMIVNSFKHGLRKTVVELLRPRGRPKRTWRQVVDKDCQTGQLNKDDATDHSKWR